MCDLARVYVHTLEYTVRPDQAATRAAFWRTADGELCNLAGNLNKISISIDATKGKLANSFDSNCSKKGNSNCSKKGNGLSLGS